MRATRTRTAVMLGSALVAGLLLAGCGSSEKTAGLPGTAGAAQDDAAAEPAAGQPNTGEQAAGQPPSDEQAGRATPAQAPDLSIDQRSIIYRGTLSVRVRDVDAAAGQTSGIATTAGGFVGGDNRNSGAGSDTATLELRVPAGKFASVVDQLARLGDEEQRQINTEDVTEQTVDLDARITVQQARVDSGRKLLAQAKSLNDLVMLEREVATRESDLASLQAKKRRLADLTALSTITVTLLDPDADAATDPDGAPGFLGGLGAGWNALVTSLGVLLTVLGAVLPWLIAVGLPLWGIFSAYRRYRRRTAVQPALAAAGPAPAPAESRKTDGDQA